MHIYGRRGFTLIELLIGMVLMIIVIAGITFGITSGVRLYERASAQASVIKGLRFTMDAFSRQITPQLNNTNYVEILNTVPAKADLSADEKCVFRSGDALVIRTKTGTDTALTGSEYISAVHFTATSRDDATNTSGDNYMLKVVLSADNPQYSSAKFSTATVQSLYNKPVRSTDNFIADSGSSNGTYEGNVLVYVEKEDLSLVFKSLHLLDAKDTGNSLDKQTKNRADVSALYSSYDLKFDSNPGFAYTDESTTEWYISAATASADSITTDTPTSSNMHLHRWRLVRNDGIFLASSHNDSAITDTASKFYVRYSTNSTAEWGKYGLLWCKVTPVLKRTSDGKTYTTTAKWTPYVVLVKSGGKGDSLLSRWVSDIDPDYHDATDKYGFFSTNEGSHFTSHYQIDEDGNAYMNIYASANSYTATEATATAGLNQVNLLDKVAKALNILSPDAVEGTYTTLTNYSVILDTKVEGKSSGWGLLLNGAASGTGTAYTDNGYVMQADGGIDAFRMNLYYDNNGQYPPLCGIDYKDIGMKLDYNLLGSKNDYNLNSEASSHLTGADGTMYYYGPGYMKNELFKYNSDSDADDDYPWTGRHRIMITLLEYYTTNKNDPKFIVRVKYLKPISDDSYADDPWQCGKRFYCSEPLWYGDYVGDKQTNFTINNKTFYGFKVNNYSYPYTDITGTNVIVGSGSRQNWTKNYYTTYAPYYKNGTNGNQMYATVFSAKEMSVIDGIKKTFFAGDDHKTFSASDRASTANTLFSNPKRNRFVALRVWDYKGTGTTVHFYGIDYAPGFTKEELLAIMPSGAKMYETSDTGQDDADKLHESINDKLFKSYANKYSSGNGVGVMGIQHMKTNCSCPTCQLSK